AGDDKVVAETKAWIRGALTCQTKTGTGWQSAEVLPAAESRARIAATTEEALRRRKEIRPVVPSGPQTLEWDYLPKGSLRTHNPAFVPVASPRRVTKTGDSVERLLLDKP
ncbi:MAG: M55 family metallopeptidase, partial [Verrucomicrobia bacterium]|nr:M55 family metallopeptidase [Verrucomicrobiota bacterium]